MPIAREKGRVGKPSTPPAMLAAQSRSVIPALALSILVMAGPAMASLQTSSAPTAPTLLAAVSKISEQASQAALSEGASLGAAVTRTLGSLASSRSSQTAPPPGLPYAQQVRASFDHYADAIFARLQSAEQLGPGGFDADHPAILGPAGDWLALDYAERLSDGHLAHHPAEAALLTQADIATALRGQRIFARDGQLLFVAPNPGGASVLGVGVPIAEFEARLPDATKPGGVLIFDRSGHLLAGNGSLSPEQLDLFHKDLPQAQGFLRVEDGTTKGKLQPQGLVTYEVAHSKRYHLIVATRMAPPGAAEPALQTALFEDPQPKPQAGSPPPSPLAPFQQYALPGALAGGGLLLLGIIFLGRRPRRLRYEELTQMERVDYLDALTEDLESEPGEDGSSEAVPPESQEPERNAARSKKTRSAGAKKARRKAPAEAPALPPEQEAALDTLRLALDRDDESSDSEAPSPPPTDQARPHQRTNRFPFFWRRPAATDAAEVADQEASPFAETLTEALAKEALAKEVLAKEALAEVAHTEIAQPAEALPQEGQLQDDQEPEQSARLLEPDELAQLDNAQEEAQRQSRIDAFHAKRDALRAARASVPERARTDRADYSRPAAIDARPEDPRLTDTRRRTVQPSDVLVTRGEVQNLLEKEGDRLLGRLGASQRESEARMDEGLDDLRDTFRQVLSEFERLQTDRERDLSEIHDLKHDLENQLASASLKIKQAEGKATDGLLRLKDQVEELARRVEGWIGDRRLAEERLGTALESLRDGWQAQLESQTELRQQLKAALDPVREATGKLESGVEREAAERRAAIDRLAFEIKAVQLGGENELSTLSGRLDELRGGQQTLGQRLDRTEAQQQQALDALNRKIEGSEGLDTIKRGLSRELELLKARLDRHDVGASEVRAALDKIQTERADEHTMLLNQLYLEIDKVQDGLGRQTTEYQTQLDALKQENSRLQARQHQMVQVLGNLHSAIGKSDAHATEELERLQLQNRQLHDMVMQLLRGSRQPQVPLAPSQSAPSQTTGPAVSHQDAPARNDGGATNEADDGKPIDLWSRLMGRTAEEEASQRKRRR